MLSISGTNPLFAFEIVNKGSLQSVLAKQDWFFIYSRESALNSLYLALAFCTGPQKRRLDWLHLGGRRPEPFGGSAHHGEERGTLLSFLGGLGGTDCNFRTCFVSTRLESF